MEFRESSFNFPETEDDGPQRTSTTMSFAREVVEVAVAVTGYSATFERQEDHHLGRLEVEVSASVDGSDATRVNINGAFGLRDWSGDFDDPYSGNIQFVVIAELVAVAPPAPGDARGDLVVADAEVTQAIQHFRSHKHLDSANVFGDNSIRLVADKPTVVRLYCDYDASSGLAPIPRLSGELMVTSGGTTTTLTPFETIVPRRDNGIERGNRTHTLNFLIPENLCRGIVTTRASVFDAADPTQFSAPFERELSFETFTVLPIMAVGITYEGDDVNSGATDAQLAAPVVSDFVNTFQFTQLVFPIPSFTITSYVTMTYDKEVKSDIDDGCDKLGDLKDAVGDLRGDSDDIVYGLYNSGLDTGSVGGCGGGGVAVGEINNGGTAAHEIGHALGRKHAPCDNVTRCAEPKNTDDDYPVYSGYDSDSIGEYGFDPSGTSGAVRDPGVFHDFMGYSGASWISPYTYKALMSAIPEEFAGGASAAFSSSSGLSGAPGASAVSVPSRPGREWIAIKQQKLFLRLAINRDRSVAFDTAFHFAARPRRTGREATDFAVELLDKAGRVLRAACLFAEDASCGCSCKAGTWPLQIRQAIAFDPKAVKLVLYECDKVIGSWPIPAPPKVQVRVEGAASDDSHFTVSWHAECHDPDAAPWYLVQWHDGRDTWRGAAPRTQETSMRVPKSLFGRRKRAALRVLASCGIATGEAGWEGGFLHPPRPPKDPAGGPPSGPVVVRLPGVVVDQPGSHALPPLLRAAALLESGAMAVRPDTRWYDSRGAEVGRGKSLDLRRLSVGEHILSAVVLDTGEGAGSASWLIERTKDDRFLLHLGDRKGRQPGPPDDHDHDDDHCDDDHKHDDHNHSHED